LSLVEHRPALLAELDPAFELVQRVGELEFARFKLLDQRFQLCKGFLERRLAFLLAAGHV
tara:strand:- start:259 stop:438 length:180 start_codon:yes stop_codon:yes gene_type:complete